MPNVEIAQIAQRVIQAAESASFDSLSRELGIAEQFATQEEERMELLGAIAHEMRATLAGSPHDRGTLHDALGPHLQILRHLSKPKFSIN